MDIAVAGAGIAGLAVASFLRRQGRSVTVYDKLSAPAPVGSGLIVQPTGQAVLEALNLNKALHVRGARLDRLDGRTEGGRRKVLDVRYAALHPGAHGLSVHRAALFDLLHQKALQSGVKLCNGREVAGVDKAGSKHRLRFADGAFSAPYDLVIDGLGVRSPLIARKSCFLDYGALWANAPFPYAEEFAPNVLVQRYRGAACSSGVMPIGRLHDDDTLLAAFFWTLRADQYESWKAAPLAQWKEEVLTLWPQAATVLDHFTSHDDFVFAHYAHHTVAHPVEGRVVHIGDSWHAASPQLGQGANMALLDAMALSHAFEHNADIDAALKAFVAMRRFHVRLYQTASRLFTPVYQSNSKVLPWLRDILAEPVSHMPPMPHILASMVAGTLGGPLEHMVTAARGLADI